LGVFVFIAWGRFGEVHAAGLSLSQKEEDAVYLFTPPEGGCFKFSRIILFAGEIGNVINQNQIIHVLGAGVSHNKKNPIVSAAKSACFSRV
jgi:hypothetical protein